MRCRLKKSIYGLEQVSRQWYLKFDEVVKKLGFIENQVDNCIYIKIKRSIFIILILYVDDILLASNDKNLLYETRGFLLRPIFIPKLNAHSMCAKEQVFTRTVQNINTETKYL
jgi:hypothetical protein